MKATSIALVTPGTCAASASVKPTDPRAASRVAGSSRPSSSSTSLAPYSEEKSEPTTATPRVPPSSRVASLTAEPTPARAGGSTCMIDSVAGVLTSPRPRPIITICGTIDGGVGDVDLDRRDPEERRAEQRQAGADDGLGADARRELGARDRGDGDGDRDGQDPHAGAERGVVAQELEELRDQEDEAEEREERDRHRAAGRAEAAVEEEGDVEHRVLGGALDERRTAAARPAAIAKPASVVAEVQPCSGASMIVQVSVPSAPTETTRPSRSRGGTPASRDSGTKARVIAIAITPTGTSAQKTLCQREVLEQEAAGDRARAPRPCRRRRPRCRGRSRARGAR